MKYFSVKEIAGKWNISERTVRNYCAGGKIVGAKLCGKTWQIPANVPQPISPTKTQRPQTLLAVLKEELSAKISGGIYHKIQLDLTYNSNRIEGSKLTHEQTRYIFETNTIGLENQTLNVNDIVETVNHFACVDMMIAKSRGRLSEKLIKELHRVLKSGTSDSRRPWFAVGAYKKLPNEVGGRATTLPENVGSEMKKLLDDYNALPTKTLNDIINFHVCFEDIHPFQDGNGRIGRLIMFKECLANNIVPFIIRDDMKLYYYRGLQEWRREKCFLTDTCLAAQEDFKAVLDYFRIPYV